MYSAFYPKFPAFLSSSNSRHFVGESGVRLLLFFPHKDAEDSLLARNAIASVSWIHLKFSGKSLVCGETWHAGEGRGGIAAAWWVSGLTWFFSSSKKKIIIPFSHLTFAILDEKFVNRGIFLQAETYLGSEMGEDVLA